MTIFLVNAPTAGREVKVITHYPGRHDLTETIQHMADAGWDFVGKISEYIPTGSIAWPTEDYLFLRDKQPSREAE